ncbi:A24 family peptidase [Maritalea mediterranea]|uniref:Prepilin peptidase n=1 Tax=Maritalea mediterranea TaxID=2909667 RepID=A0ABS9E7P8_9HYPH|nr:prepilin peptidase [Maritalea mediterranea]MCF4097471.1 prepilin peptidase [Maritalea mediterranea]
MMNTLILAIFPLMMAFCAAYDLLTMRIPNWISLVLIVAFVVAALAGGLAWAAIGTHFIAFGIALVVGILLFVPGWIGGGDAKFAASTALWMGTSSAVPFLLYAAIAGGVLTILILAFRHVINPAQLPKWPWLLKLHDKKVGIPYGVALAIAGLIVFPHTVIFTVLATI